MTAPIRRWLIIALAPLTAVAAMLAAPATAGYAAPGGSTGTTTTADDGDENPLLNEVLDATGRKYLAAKAAVDKSTKAQLGLTLELRAAEAKRDALRPEVGVIAGRQYRTGGLTAFNFLLNGRNPGNVLARAMSLQELNGLQDGKLRELDRAINAVSTAKAKLDAAVKMQQQNLAAMANQKKSAQDALALVGGESLTQGFVPVKSAIAAPAPRNADGVFAPESCKVKDPTTSGCITARTYHMYLEVKKAGFTRFVGCHRNGGPFEHPKGRACDWSLQKSGFSVAHTTDMKNYGNSLMAFLVRNAERLGILYVIWYRQIWFPATGWHSYHGASTHMDHVHVSML